MFLDPKNPKVKSTGESVASSIEEVSEHVPQDNNNN